MKTDARKLGTEQQELLRQQAVQLRLQGKSFKSIGALLNVHPNTVGQWYKRYRDGGKDALLVERS